MNSTRGVGRGPHLRLPPSPWRQGLPAGSSPALRQGIVGTGYPGRWGGGGGWGLGCEAVLPGEGVVWGTGLGRGVCKDPACCRFWPLGTDLSSWGGDKGAETWPGGGGVGKTGSCCLPAPGAWGLGRKGSLLKLFFFKYPGFVCKMCLILDPLFPRGPPWCRPKLRGLGWVPVPWGWGGGASFGWVGERSPVPGAGVCDSLGLGRVRGTRLRPWRRWQWLSRRPGWRPAPRPSGSCSGAGRS